MSEKRFDANDKRSGYFYENAFKKPRIFQSIDILVVSLLKNHCYILIILYEELQWRKPIFFLFLRKKEKKGQD